MPGPDRNIEKNPGRQSPGARRKRGAQVESSPQRGDAHPPSQEDLTRILSLSHEERSEAVRELQRRYGNQRVQRMLARLVQPDAAEIEDPNQVNPDVTDRISAQQGSGQPLGSDTRAEMESSFGRDFSDVRVHTGPEADSLNQDVQAKAFTTGSDIFFRGGNYAPGSSQGKELLAHELTHVVQQSGAPAASASGPTRVTSPNDASEVEAAQVAEAVVGQAAAAREADEEEPVAMARQAEPVEEEEVMAARQEEEELDLARQEEDELDLARQAEEQEPEEEMALARQAGPVEDEEVMAARQEEEELGLARQAGPEDEEVMAARQAAPEDEEMMAARQAAPEDEELMAARQAAPEDEEVMAARQAEDVSNASYLPGEEANASYPEEEEANMSMMPPMVVITYAGQEYAMTEEERDNFVQRLIAQKLRPFGREISSTMARARDLYDFFVDLNDDQYIVSWFSELFSGAELPVVEIAAGEAAVAVMNEALEGTNFDTAVNAIKAAEPIVNTAITAMTNYREDVISGAGTSITILQVTKTTSFTAVCVMGGAVLAAPLTAAGLSTASATVASGAIMGGSTALLDSVATSTGEAAAGSDITFGDAALKALKDSAIGAGGGALGSFAAMKLSGPVVNGLYQTLAPRLFSGMSEEAAKAIITQAIEGSASNVIQGAFVDAINMATGDTTVGDFIQNIVVNAAAGLVAGGYVGGR